MSLRHVSSQAVGVLTATRENPDDDWNTLPGDKASRLNFNKLCDEASLAFKECYNKTLRMKQSAQKRTAVPDGAMEEIEKVNILADTFQKLFVDIKNPIDVQKLKALHQAWFSCERACLPQVVSVCVK